MLSVEGHVSVRTADGAFDDEADVTLQYRESGGPSTTRSPFVPSTCPVEE